MLPHSASPRRAYGRAGHKKIFSMNSGVMHTGRRPRFRPLVPLAAMVFVTFCLIFSLWSPQQSLSARVSQVNSLKPKELPTEPSIASPDRPVPDHLGSSHPILDLSQTAEQIFEETLQKQSKSLEQAVGEYRRRYGIPPPPNFDKWYEFAKSKGVQLIDEYDSIHYSLTPFWGLKPSTIRGRAREAQGYSNNLMSMMIRGGEITNVEGGGEWMQVATQGMMEHFVKYLPDMDLCFNIHDEPRVVVPYDDLRRLVTKAKEVAMPAANAVTKPRNSWSNRSSDLNDGSHIDDVKTSRFNSFSHQSTWSHSRMSCPPDSPSRALDDGPKDDNYHSYSVTELGFIHNQTAFSDICQSPSFSETYGFFDHSNAFNVVQDLFPIFSQSKLSSYSDILYPSPWYWYGKVPYNQSADMDWVEKSDSIFWRGSTTGGYSRQGGWKRHHRQKVVQKVNAKDQAKILVNQAEDLGEDWQIKQVPRRDFKDIFDIYFSHVGQCDPGDCAAQKEFFDIKEPADQQDMWKYKYLLDMDGNAFSGRFYAFLKSKSLVYKMALSREWHEEWLKPWVHFIPLSLRGDEWVEVVRWFAVEPAGKTTAERIALQSRTWADKVLRNEDMEVWFFRLLLEYGRLVDDDREIIGYIKA